MLPTLITLLLPFALAAPSPLARDALPAAHGHVHVHARRSSAHEHALLRQAAALSAGPSGASIPRVDVEYVKVRRRISDSGSGPSGRRRERDQRQSRSPANKAKVKVKRKREHDHDHVPNKKRECSEPATEEEQTPVPLPEPHQPVSGTSGNAIFPIAPRDWWSTAPGQSGYLDFNSALKPLTAGRLPPVSSAPDSSSALLASYPAHTVKYSSATGHGFSFYTSGAHANVDVTSASEILFSYAVYFSDGFDFVRGGKLPGVYGGVSLEEAKSCSGGRQGERDGCFSARLMWRGGGAGEIYNYLPTSGKQEGGYCQTSPMSVCDANFGDSIGRGSFYFQPNKWTTVTQRVKLNSPASASNGEQELWVDGHPVLHLTGLQLRVSDDARFYGIMAQTFFGGSDDSWASPKDQWAWFKDWSLGVVA